ncbi:MAG: DUF2852 domain-containing protein [Pseudomonadota bacterium]
MIHSQTANKVAENTSTPFLKPGWAPINIFLMIVGFILFWPLGVAMLAYNIWGHKLPEFKKDLKRSFSAQTDWMTTNPDRTEARPTGNAAFDAYRAREFARLEEERAKIEAMRQEFDEHMESLRQARDQEEFDRFMAARKAKNRGDDVMHT